MYDIIVLGGGHAGCEAALACARMNNKTLMVVGNVEKIANMPCNPSFGGPAKGIIIREIDALGGQMAKAVDATLLQLKMLNSSKGPAVRALRAQADKQTYPAYMKKVIDNTENLEVLEDLITDLIIKDGSVIGVKINEREIYSKSVIIASGTYLDSYILCGHTKRQSGPEEQKTTSLLSKNLKKNGLRLIRLKTGTPARIEKDSVDYSKMQVQYGDKKKLRFSEETKIEDIIPFEKQVKVYLTYTSSNTHQIIIDNLEKSSMYAGITNSVGPRYCPSIEDKIVRFKDKSRHQLFVEPEGRDIPEMYPQGFSTSMPHDVQDKMIASVPGLEKSKIKTYAYAIEYDAIDPLELKPTLECKKIDNLYFAGQVNGTSGYEEAGCQGLMAGINASLKLQSTKQIVLRRDEAYIGVLIDDLVTKGVTDPYRMLTSRAEFRLILRHDNSEERLLKYGYETGLVSKQRYDNFIKKQKVLEDITEKLKNIYITPKPSINKQLIKEGKDTINSKVSGFNLLKRSHIQLEDIEKLYGETFDIDQFEKERLTIAIKYEGYIKKEYRNTKRMVSMENKKIPEDINYDDIPNIALEAKDKLKKVRPLTISQASRISGVNPSDIAILVVYIKAYKKVKK